MKQRERNRLPEKRRMGQIMLVVFLAMLPLNLLTPLISDDFSYCYSFADGEKIQSVLDIFRSQYAHYHIMNGRVVLHFLVQLSLLLPHVIFKVVNSAAYVGLGVLIYVHAAYGKGSRPLLLGIIYLAMWAWLPYFGGTVLWQDGACNYLWGACLILSFLLPYRMYYSNENVCRKKFWIPILFLLGFGAGACNENTSGAACMAVVLFLMRYAMNKKKLPAWTVAGLAGAVAGFFFMLLAPGNLYRAQNMIANSPDSFLHVDSLRDLVLKFAWITHKIQDVAGIWLVFVTIFLGAYLIFKNRSFRKLELPVIYLLCFLGSVYAMLIPPTFPDRTMFGPVVFWLICLAGMLPELEVKWDRAVTMALLTCVIFVTVIQYGGALKQNALVSYKYQQRVSYVREQKAQGNLNLVFDYVEPHGKYCAWDDMTADPDNYYNAGFARYYGIESAVVEGGPTEEE